MSENFCVSRLHNLTGWEGGAVGTDGPARSHNRLVKQKTKNGKCVPLHDCREHNIVGNPFRRARTEGRVHTQRYLLPPWKSRIPHAPRGRLSFTFQAFCHGQVLGAGCVGSGLWAYICVDTRPNTSMYSWNKYYLQYSILPPAARRDQNGSRLGTIITPRRTRASRQCPCPSPRHIVKLPMPFWTPRGPLI